MDEDLADEPRNMHVEVMRSCGLPRMLEGIDFGESAAAEQAFVYHQCLPQQDIPATCLNPRWIYLGAVTVSESSLELFQRQTSKDLNGSIG